MASEIKKRNITSKDWDSVEQFVKKTYDERKNSKFRTKHERIWREVDRQIEMRPLKRLLADGKDAPQSWHNAIELGELAKASEIIASDVMRITFPQDRFWFAPHVQLAQQLNDKTGQAQRPDPERQDIDDGLLRSLMSQQHKDFGFKARFRLSVKEALHHGSFVAEIRFEDQLMVRSGGKIKRIGAPVWVPYSMWNCYPDPSPSVIGTNLFYTGAMVLVEYMPLHKLKGMSGKGWIKSRLKKVEKRDNTNKDEQTQDAELVKYKGDIVIERDDGDIFLPNSEVILANDRLVYYSEAKLPYPNVIFAGYERQDVRDPYYTSPIIKQSPIHRMTTIAANKFLDAAALKVEPPIEYDANDPDYVASGGPEISPGGKSATRSMGKGFTALDIGDPKFALDAFTLGMQQMREGLGVSAQRAGVREADRETATSANLANQGAEVRTMEFISQLEPQGLLPFLYMQHELNRMDLDDYTFYNDEMHTPDFMVAHRKDIQEDVHFDVVGSRGVLGEEKRDRKIAETTAFFANSPLFAPKLQITPLMLEMYRDAGKKNPEEWVKADDNKPQVPPEVMQKVQEMQQALQQAGQENAMLKSKHGDAMAKIVADMKQFTETHAFDKEAFNKEFALKVAEFNAGLLTDHRDHVRETSQHQDAHHLAIADHLQQSIQNDAENAAETATETKEE